MDDTDLDAHAAFARETHDYLRQHIQFADQKAAFVFAAGATLLGILHSRAATTAWWRTPDQWTVHTFLGFVASIGLVAGLGCTASVVIPRRKGSPRGYIFWEAILGHGSANAFVTSVMELAPNALVHEKLYHCYELAAICSRKYGALASALRLCALGFFASILYFLPF